MEDIWSREGDEPVRAFVARLLQDAAPKLMHENALQAAFDKFYMDFIQSRALLELWDKGKVKFRWRRGNFLFVPCTDEEELRRKRLRAEERARAGLAG